MIDTLQAALEAAEALTDDAALLWDLRLGLESITQHHARGESEAVAEQVAAFRLRVWGQCPSDDTGSPWWDVWWTLTGRECRPPSQSLALWGEA